MLVQGTLQLENGNDEFCDKSLVAIKIFASHYFQNTGCLESLFKGQPNHSELLPKTIH